ncbi:APC family permease [[Mycoplasma] collis]|uniref:APC family permease n=1 Tax=[Mycoplasma] collis TaxID=2127 RepID=UPI00051BC07B|nr:amino acid permease [[Mycoplasma] collis]
MLDKTKKIGFFTALAMLIGSVVGVGIFFKNNSVAKAVDNNGITWLLTWILGGVVSLAAAINFSEIGTLKLSKISGIASWAYKLNGLKSSYAIKITWVLFYLGLLFTVFGTFVTEAFFFFLQAVGALEMSKIPFFVIPLIGIIFSVFFVTVNVLSLKTSSIIQITTVILKFLPLVFTMIVGIIFLNTNNSGEQSFNAFVKFTKSFSFKGMIIALPSVLFAYDAFLTVGSITSKLKSPRKNQFLVTLIGMITIIVLYSLIAVSSILHNQGTIQGLLETSLSQNVAKFIVPIIALFIFISVFGTFNGFTLVLLLEVENSVDIEILFGSKWIKKHFSQNYRKIIYLIGIYTFWFLIIILPSLILQNDRIIDGMSNFPTIFYFNIYAYLVISYLLKRNKMNETRKINSILFYIFAFIFILGIVVVEISYIYVLFNNLFDSNFVVPWGFFMDGGKLTIDQFPAYSLLLIYIMMLVFFISLPFLNFYLEKLIFKHNNFKNFAQNIKVSEKIKQD